jgi:membrane fusion protein (multidrug efflux system)
VWRTTRLRRKFGAVPVVSRTYSFIIAALSLSQLAGCRTKEAPPAPAARPPTPVEVYQVAPRKLVRTVDAVGTLRSPASTEVTAEFPGKVVYLDVPEGKRVKKGHVLARLDASTMAAELAVAKARLAGARDTLGRTQALEKEQLIAKHAVDDASNATNVAEREVSRQSVTVQKTIIAAPFDGLVGIREVSPGAYVVPGSPITQITNMNDLELVFSVPERYVGKMEVGQAIRGVVGACTHRFTGKVAVLEPAVDPGTRTLRVLASVSDPSGALRPGMSASVKVEVEVVEGAVSLPLEAVIRRGTQEHTFLVGPGEVAERRAVRTGDVDQRFVEILRGVASGDRVVTSGHQKIRPGAKVEAKPWQPIDNSNLDLGSVPEEADCWF